MSEPKLTPAAIPSGKLCIAIAVTKSKTLLNLLLACFSSSSAVPINLCKCGTALSIKFKNNAPEKIPTSVINSAKSNPLSSDGIISPNIEAESITPAANDKTISEENKEAIEYFKREGGYFTFITGRMPYYSIDAYNAANPNVPYGCVNGGGIYDGREHRYVWTYPIDSSVLELVEYIDERFENIGIQVCGFDTTYFAKDNVFSEMFRKITKLPKNIRHYRDVKEPFAKIIFVVNNWKEL